MEEEIIQPEIVPEIVPSQPVPEPVLEQAYQVVAPQEPVTAPAQEPAPEPAQATAQIPVSQINTAADFMKNLSAKALFSIQTHKKEKLERIMTLFDKKTEVTNDEVEKLLHVSDATATRYLEILVKENKVTKVGTKGRQVFYTKV